jgi:hypothetical protein
MTTNKMTHTLERSSPFGEKFIGYCITCGLQNLPMEAAFWKCENTRGLTKNEALIEAIEGPKYFNHNEL